MTVEGPSRHPQPRVKAVVTVCLMLGALTTKMKSRMKGVASYTERTSCRGCEQAPPVPGHYPCRCLQG